MFICTDVHLLDVDNFGGLRRASSWLMRSPTPGDRRGAASGTACAWRVLGGVAVAFRCPSLEHLLEALERSRKSREWRLRAQLGAQMTRYEIPEKAEY